MRSFSHFLFPRRQEQERSRPQERERERASCDSDSDTEARGKRRRVGVEVEVESPPVSSGGTEENAAEGLPRTRQGRVAAACLAAAAAISITTCFSIVRANL